ncbi:MAG: M48 family metallopeptidase [Lachnospiraceae bacterium]|nr:M48 family metallopeptidase [Lachnospiraceae bacterium]
MAENPADTCIVRRSRRKTLSLEITPEGKLIIRAPLRASDEEILSFARSHREWIADKIREAASRKQQREEYERRHHIRPLTRAELKELGKAAAEYIPMRAAHYAAIMGVDFNRITIRNQTTRWGSCSAKKNLNFNALLMLTPGEVIDSVIVHELAHLKHMDHSQAFYAEVLRVYPDYRKWDRWLKKNGELLMRRLPRS